ncbi:Phosphoribosyl-AMP cyclohydrolase [Porphyridium purpureum]|uniref:Histidine biosynthesis bifunctional protein HisIE n=1 Tax=Porphyridium purpureum TaxID=35688 RepID=A0A5J4YKL0_PORPP|nr:Phosphoribosyl-AMP cyclohydrolase [Porphyridium purpureum]|eukprot:POR9016..scf244_11
MVCRRMDRGAFVGCDGFARHGMTARPQLVETWAACGRLPRRLVSNRHGLAQRALVQCSAADDALWKHRSVDAQRVLQRLKMNEDGLIAAIAQQHDTKQVLMMAWMNAASVEETLTTGRVCYYSRSRKALWRKGESSGQVQMLTGFAFDCDADTLLLQVDQLGVACHTGRTSCFFNEVRSDGVHESIPVSIDPKKLYS